MSRAHWQNWSVVVVMLAACQQDPTAGADAVVASGTGDASSAPQAGETASDSASPQSAAAAAAPAGGRSSARSEAGSGGNSARSTPPAAADDAGLPNPSSTSAGDVETRLTDADWLSYGHDLSNTRHNPGETRISADNVAQLQLKWTWSTVAVTSTPTYSDGALYFADWLGAVVAVDAASGRERWRRLDSDVVIGMITGSTWVDRDALFIGGNTSFWYRLNRGSGAIEWRKTASTGGSANTLSSPVRVGDLVIAGIASFQNINPIDSAIGAPPFHGSVVALHADTGEKVWEFLTTKGTGVGVCSSAAIDPARKRLFIGTGQNYDSTDAPYADSLLALNYESGEYVWHAQYNQGDSWGLGDMDDGDLDVLATPVLYTVDGLDLVAAGDKGGSFRAFDRDGKPQWRVQLTPGGHHGGVMGSPATHHGVLYVCSGDFTTDNGDITGQSGPMKSTLFALDGRTGESLWRTPIEGACYGSITHANGVVYLPTVNGFIRAYDDRDGRALWSANLGGSSAGGVTVAHGMLYVTYGWSWSELAPAGGVKAFGLP